MQQTIIIQAVQSDEDILISEHFYKMWIDVGIPEDGIEDNWQEIIIQFIENARQNLFYQSFLAEIDGVIVGSTSCQLYAGLYPNAIKSNYRQFGYIWGVYVEPEYRRKGIAKQLTNTAIEHLKNIGCTRIILNASPDGKPVYQSLAFVESNAMHLDLA
ncbi:GNAT family N-acetyltransferase [Brunnivagina elsteri]|uniref:GNAT family N-acetyltransferase n=1 Tax=Brunnivagina elsteri CCALA 953 TaxID=987040 RepID=A0A2A2TIU1_9CYAN|nr:GNAT family N-acetyltransferase [Calothrix elsteri]PAX54101.1 GNAT family N-acetyltransferase [Calothrix elsteri CCALA 953]